MKEKRSAPARKLRQTVVDLVMAALLGHEDMRRQTPPVGPSTAPASTENAPSAARNHRLDPQPEQKPRTPPPAV
jgi:hypothetical protein